MDTDCLQLKTHFYGFLRMDNWKEYFVRSMERTSCKKQLLLLVNMKKSETHITQFEGNSQLITHPHSFALYVLITCYSGHLAKNGQKKIRKVGISGTLTRIDTLLTDNDSGWGWTLSAHYVKIFCQKCRCFTYRCFFKFCYCMVMNTIYIPHQS